MFLRKKDLSELYEKINGLSDRVSYLENYISIYEYTEAAPPTMPGYSGYTSTYKTRLTDIKALLLELLKNLGYEVKAPEPVKDIFLYKKEEKEQNERENE